MKRAFLFVLSLSMTGLWGQGYQFTEKINLDASPVISQGHTGTCWSFSTSSFLESEIKRVSGKDIDLSEMYNVRQTYPMKAQNYLMRQGHAQFGEGGLAHDVINSAKLHGLAPQSAYTGHLGDETYYNHSEMTAVLQSLLDAYNEKPADKMSSHWREAVYAILDVYMGPAPESFEYEGKNYTPQSFLAMTGLKPENYLTVTSFTQHPFYDSFILNIPDNFSNGSMYNVPLDDMMEVVDHALENGYSVELDVDVSEPTFSAQSGVAVIPENASQDKAALSSPQPEKKISQQYRQEEFENQSTTDDHLMHITGVETDQNGTRYYKVKNSWGPGLAHGGYVFMSESYLRLKAISVMVNKEAIPKKMAKELNI